MMFSPNDRNLFTDDQSGPLIDASRDVAMATNFGQNLQNDLYFAGWCFKMERNIADPIQKCLVAIL